jgi:hypothetical protein
MTKTPKTPQHNDAPEAKKHSGDLPAKIRLVEPHGFIDDAGEHRYWQQGQNVTDPDDIAILVDRAANYEVV